ncbi:MAG: helicase-related protein [Candidatus Shapirobacteria bacterium]
MDVLSTLKNVGPISCKKLNDLGVFTLGDLLFYLPFRYLDFSHTLKISQFTINQPATYSGKVISFQNIFTHSHKNIQRATIEDSTGSLNLIWFNQPYLAKNIVIGQTLSVAGTVSYFKNKTTIIAPLIGQKTGRIIPLYHQSSNLNSSWIERTIKLNLDTLFQNYFEILPENILLKYHLFDIKTALIQIHQPLSQELLNQAKDRINLHQSLSLLAQSELQKQNILNKKPAYLLTKNPKTNFLPYNLSTSQQIAWSEIQTDLLSQNPTHRLLSGDVGSGKTIIALLAAHLTSVNKHVSLIVAPTQVLANQHFEFFKKTLPKFPIFLLNNKSKLPKIPSNAIIISTHAAFYQDQSFFKKIALLVIDEQHKFGVVQRNFLAKLTQPPHTISMTATPIPRTLALSLYGHLDISFLTHLPHWKPVKTFIVPEQKISDCYLWLKNQIEKTKQQAFIVCPFIEDSESLTTVKSATTEFAKLKPLFPKLKLELIHGKIPETKRQEIFAKFKANKINILVTTPIIEVGIDFPNATVVVIQSADRFGLASLHQLRGRVGRGVDPGYCYLFTDNEQSNRLKYLTTHYEGQQLAEFDLKIRGPGELFSTLQSGHFYFDEKSIMVGKQIISDLLKINFDLKKTIINQTNTNTTN